MKKVCWLKCDKSWCDFASKGEALFHYLYGILCFFQILLAQAKLQLTVYPVLCYLSNVSNSNG